MQPQLRVELWPIALCGRASDADLRLLSPAETARARRFRQPADAADFVVVRAELRRRLGSILGRPPEATPLLDPAGRRPELGFLPQDLPVNGALSFNVSHTDGLALIAICRGARVGVDVERIVPLDDDVTRMILSRREHDEWARLREPQRTRVVLRAWIRKEAVLKGLGLGIARDLATLDVPLAATVANAAVEGVAPEWRLFSVDVGSRWEAALAVEAGSRAVDLHLHP